MKKPFRVILKVNNQYVIHEARKEKVVDTLLKAFNENDKIEEVSVYIKSGMAYDLVVHEHKGG